LGNYIYYILRPYRNLNKLPDLTPIAKAKAKTEFATRAVVIREETLIANKVLTVTKDYERHHNRECKLSELASVNESATGDKTISNAKVFEDTVSYQSLDNNLYNVNHILAKKQEYRSTYYLVL
jgi:hypothetical protein